VEGNRNILVFGLPIAALVVLAVMLLPETASKFILYLMLLLVSLFLIFLVLIQRGKGGGLAGALGGMGGSSAFGARAGDVFTMITIVAASFWILSAMALARINLAGGQNRLGLPDATATQDPKKPGLSSGDSAARDKDSGSSETTETPPPTESPAEKKRFLDDPTAGKKEEPGSDQ